MSFQISALPHEQFSHLYGAPQDMLAEAGVLRLTADNYPGFPCRVSLEDAAVGETVLLLNFEHLPVESPYRSRHAIFVREGATMAQPAINEIPESLASRLLSVRSFDEHGMLIDCEVTEGRVAQPLFHKMLANESAQYLHIHNARPGCYAARVDRA